MADYHVGVNKDGIYAGLLDKRTKKKFVFKSDVTTEALSCAAQYLMQTHKELRFKVSDKYWVLKVVPDEVDPLADLGDLPGEDL